MAPTIGDNELVIIERVNGEEVQVGNIILYASLSDTAVIHRVVRLEEKTSGPVMVTCGDGCSKEDVPTPVDRVVGRVVSVERNGTAVPLHAPYKLWRRLLNWLGFGGRGAGPKEI